MNKYERECRKHFNEIGLLNDTKICRLIGYADDGEDYYWIVQKPGVDNITYASMVGPWVTLKKYYPRYKELDKQMTNLWGCPMRDEFLVKLLKPM